MRKIIVTQKDWNGRGDDRKLVYWVKPGQVELKLRSIGRAFNMDSTEVQVS